MRISTRGQYAVKALVDIAYFDKGRPQKGQTIAERQELPHRYLENILRRLREAGIINIGNRER